MDSLRRVLEYLVARLKEPSTYPQIVLVLSAFGVYLKPEQTNAILMIGLAVAGIIGAALPDRIGTNTRQDDVKPPEKP